jgi:hypothetical protein
VLVDRTSFIPRHGRGPRFISSCAHNSSSTGHDRSGVQGTFTAENQSLVQVAPLHQVPAGPIQPRRLGRSSEAQFACSGVVEARETACDTVTPLPQSPRAPCSRASIPDLLLSAGRRERPGCQAAVRGPELTAVRTGSSDPSGRGWRPSQRSQTSPRPPTPRALGYASAISRRCRRQAMVSSMKAAPCFVVSSPPDPQELGLQVLLHRFKPAAPLLG